MKRLSALCLFLPVFLYTQQVLGQDSVPRFSVLFSPALFVPVSVALQVGIQYRLNRRWGLLAEGAYPTFHPANTEYEKINYWRSGIELKLYAPKPHVPGRYYAIQTNYFSREFINNKEGNVHGRGTEYHYDAATINSSVLSLAIKLGAELYSKNRKKFADVFLGMGVRHLFNDYKTETLRPTSLNTPHDNLAWLLPEEGWRFNYPLNRFHFTAGVRLGFKL